MAITAAAGFMAALDNLVVTSALTAIREDLGGSLPELEWTVSAYSLAFAVLLMPGAALGDRFGRRRLFTLGLAVFTAASAAAALAPGVEALIAARAVQGAGAAVMTPLALLLLTAAVPAARRGAVLGVYSAVTGVAVAGGPLIGGVLTEHISWQWIFWLNVPIGASLIPLARIRLTESYAPRAPFDVLGALLIGGGLLGLVYALVNGHADGWTSVPVLTSSAAGAALLAAFVRHGRTHPHPVLPMRLFRGRAFAGINAASLLMHLGMFGSIFLLSQYLQGGLGLSPTEAGVRMLPWTAAPLLVAPFAGRLADRVGGGPVVAAGLGLQAAGLALFALVLEPGVPYAALLPALIAGGVGMGLFYAPAASVLMSSVVPAERGAAAGANNALREVGGVLGIAVLGAVFASRGGFASPEDFRGGVAAALWTGAAAVALGCLAALLVPARPAPKPVPAAAGRASAAG
ncbi:DHA2 family efflux MFS transporter permease subunit [Streptomyces sp. NPDC020141]|uniref:DHA2 family efflux MFS transporter permease subunit n=1 Tax=Streptomyces sp. NPDC020141 TaxID=3365065 RepID=UPI0037B8E29D